MTHRLYYVHFTDGRYLNEDNAIDDHGEPMLLDSDEATAFAAEHPDAYAVPSYVVIDDGTLPMPARPIQPAQHDADFRHLVA